LYFAISLLLTKYNEMHIARTRDERTTKMEDENAALKAKHVELASSLAAAIAKLGARDETIATLKAENAALKAQAASKLTETLAAVTTGAMEILPVRSDSGQFVEWRVGGVPPPSLLPPLMFDRAWCSAVCARGWKADATPQYAMHNYGGWCIAVAPSRAGGVHSDPMFSGWTLVPPAVSAYATTDEVPPVPAGGAVEFAVDYAAGTCRVAQRWRVGSWRCRTSGWSCASSRPRRAQTGVGKYPRALC
jgi:hypothetical protein